MKFSILFLFLTLVVLMANNYQKQQIQEVEFYQEQIVTNVQTGELLHLQSEAIYFRLRNLLENWSKHRYIECGTTLKRMNQCIKSVAIVIKQEIEQFTSSTNYREKYEREGKVIIQQQMIKLQEELRAELALLLEKKGTTFGLKANEIDEKLEEWFVEINRLELNLIARKTPLSDQLWLSKLLVDLEQVHLFLSNEVAALSGGRTINCGIGLGAVVMPTKHATHIGDTFSAHVGFGYYSIPEDVSDYWITVNGDTLSHPENWMPALFETKVGTNRRVEFDVHYVVRNQITGHEEDYSRRCEYEIPLP